MGIEQLHHLSKSDTSEYSSDDVRGLIDRFAPAMHEHLSDEIDALLALKEYDHAGLMKAYEKSEERIHGIVDEAKVSTDRYNKDKLSCKLARHGVLLLDDGSRTSRGLRLPLQ